MSSRDIELLKEISKKLSQLIVLSKLSNSKHIEDTKREIQKDNVSKSILELADGSLSSEELKQEVINATKVSASTVQRRLLDLVEKGALIPNRKGREIYYENSGLYD